MITAYEATYQATLQAFAQTSGKEAAAYLKGITPSNLDQFIEIFVTTLKENLQ